MTDETTYACELCGRECESALVARYCAEYDDTTD